MALDEVLNAGYTTVTNSPSTSGTDIDCDDGSVFGVDFPLHVVVAPATGRILPGNYEIVRIDSILSDTVTVTRAQQGTSAIDIASGYRIFAGVLAHHLTDIYNYQEFLVNGKRFALTRAGIQAAVDAALDVGGGRIVIVGLSVTMDGTAITLGSNIELTGTPGCTLKLLANSTAYNMFTITGATGSNVLNLSVNGAVGDRAVTVASGGGVYAENDLVIIQEATTRYRAQVSYVKSGVTGTSIPLKDALTAAYTTARGVTITKLGTPISNLKITNLNFDANGNTGASRCFYSTYGLINSEFSNLTFKDFYRSVIYNDTGYKNRIQNIKMIGCGSGAHDSDIGESAIQMMRNSFLTIDTVETNFCGFAVGAYYGSTAMFTNIKDSWANGRSVKFHAQSYSVVSNSHVMAGWTATEKGSSPGWTGFIISGGSTRCRGISCSSIGNGSYGFAMDWAEDCKWIDCDSQGNIDGDFIVSNVDGTSTDNSLINCSYTTISDAGTRTTISDRKRIDLADFAAAPTVKGQLVRNGDDLYYYNGAVVQLTGAAVASHGASSHTNRTMYRELVPWANIGTGSVTALTQVIDAHSSLPVNGPHIHFADGDDGADLTVAFYPMVAPADFVSGGKINIWWSSPATSLDAQWCCSVYQPAIGFATTTTLVNSGSTSEGFIATTSNATTLKMNLTTFSMGVISGTPVAGRPMYIAIWRDAAAGTATDTLADVAYLYYANFEYTADQ